MNANEKITCDNCYSSYSSIGKATVRTYGHILFHSYALSLPGLRSKFELLVACDVHPRNSDKVLTHEIQDPGQSVPRRPLFHIVQALPFFVTW
jgi:hypothetical protein